VNECKALLSGLRSFRIEDNPDYRKLFPESGRGPQRRPRRGSADNSVKGFKPTDAPVPNKI
jgi:hypothetical protein